MIKTRNIIIVLAMFFADARDVFADFSRIDGANELEKNAQIVKGKNKDLFGRDPSAGIKKFNVNNAEQKVTGEYTRVITIDGVKQSSHFSYGTDTGKTKQDNFSPNQVDDYFEQQKRKFDEQVRNIMGGQGFGMNFGEMNYGGGQTTGYRTVTITKNGETTTVTEKIGDDQQPESNPAMEKAYKMGLIPGYKPTGQVQPQPTKPVQPSLQDRYGVQNQRISPVDEYNKKVEERLKARERERAIQEEQAKKDREILKARQEAERLDREKKAKELKDQQERERQERLARNEAVYQQKLKEARENQARVQQLREEADKLAREKRARDLKDQQIREEAERLAREKKARELKEQQAREEAERLAREKKARELKEQQAREEAERLAREKARQPTTAYKDPLANIDYQPKVIPKTNDFVPTTTKDTVNQTPIPTDLGRPIKIIFDKSFLMDSLDNLRKKYKKEEKNLFAKQIIEVIEKTDSFLRNYIFSKIPERTIVVPEKYRYCVPSNDNEPFQIDQTRLVEKKTYVADLLIFVFAMDSENDPEVTEVASALPCKTFPDGTAMFGTLRVNISKLLAPKNVNNPFQMGLAIQVIVHEIFHIIAFHSSIQDNFREKADMNYPHLYKFKQYDIKEAIINGAHWNQDFIYNDLMIPEQLANTVLSIFSLEYVELANKNIYATYRKNLQNNILLDKIRDWRHFLTYTCDESEEKSAYEHLCTLKQFHSHRWNCDSTYQYVNVCDDKQDVKTKCIKNVPHQKYICTDMLTEREKNEYTSYGPDSRCFESASGKSAYCLKTKIENNKLFVIGPEEQYECMKKNQQVTISFSKPDRPNMIFSVNFVCPDPADFIDKFIKTSCPEFCNYNGVCDSGQCHCFEGYSKTDNCKYRASFDHITTFMEAYK